MRGDGSKFWMGLALAGATLVLTSAARAEFATSVAPVGFAAKAAEGAPLTHASSVAATTSPIDVDWPAELHLRFTAVASGSPATSNASADSPDGVSELPAPPSSFVLGLTALAGIGAYRAGRSLRKVHLSHLPDWYHTGAKQVGHATPLDLVQRDLPPCVLDAPAPAQPRIITFALEVVVRLPSEFVPSSAAPRGPPLPVQRAIA